MNEVNFGVRLDKKRFQKLEGHLEKIRLSKRAFMELTIDELRPALDVVCATPKKPKLRAKL